MNEKTAEKSKRLIKADLNFVSEKPLEVIVQEIETLKHKNVTTQIEWTEGDTALFQLTYNRDERPTAEVSGRLQRWAGNMTHIYCDGRAFHKKMSYVSSFVRWLVVAILAAPFFTCPLAIFSGSEVFLILYVYSLYAFTFVGFIVGMMVSVSHLMRITTVQRHNPKQGLSKPEKKDRERLLQFLTEIIRDADYEQLLQAQEAQAAKTLSDEEAIAFLERAALKARLKKL